MLWPDTLNLFLTALKFTNRAILGEDCHYGQDIRQVITFVSPLFPTGEGYELLRYVSRHLSLG